MQGSPRAQQEGEVENSRAAEPQLVPIQSTASFSFSGSLAFHLLSLVRFLMN